MADAQSQLTVTAGPGAMADGAVAELTDHGDGIITAEIRIPGPAAP
jgi:hypothetical protein